MYKILGWIVAITGICYALGAVLLGWALRLGLGFVGWCNALDKKLEKLL